LQKSNTTNKEFKIYNKNNKNKNLPDPIIKFSNFCFQYPSSNSKIEFEGEFAIYKNEFVLISGPSGSGKTTFLNILKGIIPFYIEGKLKGKIYVENFNIIDNYPEELKSRILLLFQNPYTQIVTPYVKDELVFTMENFNLSKKEIYKNFLEVSKIFNFFNILNNETFKLSGGEIQKVMLASLIAVQPDIILLDEPTAFLDPESRKTFFNFIHKIKGKYTILIIEHNISEIIDLVDKVVYFDKAQKVSLYIRDNFIKKFNYLFYNNNINYQNNNDNTSPNINTNLKQNPNKNIKTDTNTNINTKNNTNYNTNTNINTNTNTNTKANTNNNNNINENNNKKPYINYKKSSILQNSSLLKLLLQNTNKFNINENKKNINLKIKNLFFKYKKSSEFLFENLNLELKNESISIIGKNGAGKTTLLKLISGIIKPSSGYIYSNKENIAFMFQNPETHFMFYTVKKEILHNISTWLKDKKQINIFFESIVNYFDLNKLINKNTFNL